MLLEYLIYQLPLTFEQVQLVEGPGHSQPNGGIKKNVTLFIDLDRAESSLDRIPYLKTLEYCRVQGLLAHLLA